MSQIIHGLPREQYDAIDRHSFSRLKLMGRSPLHFKSLRPKDTAAKRLGTFADMALSEPERFAGLKVWAGDKVKAAKAWKDFKAANPEGTYVCEEERDEAIAMRDAILAHPIAGPIFSDGKAQPSILWELEGEGFRFELKSRPDWISADGVLVDLKTTRNVSRRAFGKQAADLDYPAQLAFYSRALEAATGAPAPRRLIVAVESEPPYPVVVYELTEKQLADGWNKCAGWLGTLSECERTGVWPGPATEVVPLELPHWAEISDEDEQEAA